MLKGVRKSRSADQYPRIHRMHAQKSHFLPNAHTRSHHPHRSHFCGDGSVDLLSSRSLTEQETQAFPKKTSDLWMALRYPPEAITTQHQTFIISDGCSQPHLPKVGAWHSAAARRDDADGGEDGAGYGGRRKRGGWESICVVERGGSLIKWANPNASR